MRHRSDRKPSPALVISFVALCLAMGGTGYAALKLPKNSVGSSQIKTGAVQRADLAKNAVSADKVADGSLRAADFAPGQIPAGAKGDPGLPGLKGDKGDPGAKGEQGVAGTPGSGTTSGTVTITAATGAGTTVTLLAVGPISYTGTCIDHGSNTFELKVKMATSEAGAVAVSAVGSANLTGTPLEFWSANASTQFVFTQRQQVITPTNQGHRADVLVGVHTLAADCVARIDATA